MLKCLSVFFFRPITGAGILWVVDDESNKKYINSRTGLCPLSRGNLKTSYVKSLAGQNKHKTPRPVATTKFCSVPRSSQSMNWKIRSTFMPLRHLCNQYRSYKRA